MIPFYGASDRDMFAIERAAMDRSGRVLAALDRRLPTGRIIDVGAGDGFTAEALTTSTRSIVALEPAAGMLNPDRRLPWVRGVAQHLPFRNDCFDGAYSTWAYFFPQYHDVTDGLRELDRVVSPGGTTVIVDNAGDDAFTEMAADGVAPDLDTWAALGFDIEIVETAFEFTTMAEATRLLTFYFGPRAEPALDVPFHVAVMTRTVGG